MEPLVIDPRSSELSWRQLARQLRDRIRVGAYRDVPVPSIRQLTGETGLSVNTVRHALAELEAEGWVVIVPGRGTYAAEKLPGA
jgi:DNA-binding GntR family transcriptional regulator